MLPQTEDLPTSASQFLCHGTITHAISAKFISPVRTIAPGISTVLRAIMPETPIHKNCQPFAAEKKVWSAWQLLMTQPARDARLTKNGGKLQLRVFISIGTDCSHHPRTLFPIKYISHGNGTDFFCALLREGAARLLTTEHSVNRFVTQRRRSRDASTFSPLDQHP